MQGNPSGCVMMPLEKQISPRSEQELPVCRLEVDITVGWPNDGAEAGDEPQNSIARKYHYIPYPSPHLCSCVPTYGLMQMKASFYAICNTLLIVI